VGSSLPPEGGRTVKPKVLLAATNGWYTTAQLAIALAKAGCAVEAICPARHPLSKTRVVQKLYAYRGFAPVASFAAALAAAKPDFIVPGDDLATAHLHHLYRREQQRGKSGERICGLIERSLGVPESFPVVYARSAFMQLAEAEGVRVPKTGVVGSVDELRAWIGRIGLPVVLKANGTSGGDGVRVVHSLEDAERVFQMLQAPPLLARAGKRALVDKDMTLVLPSLLRRRSVVNVQSFVSGHEATSAVFCWKGVVLAALQFEVVKKRDAAGPATVLRLIDNPEMSAAGESMVRQLKLSGVHGFDFMLEAGTGHAYLIEINPRATQVGHLTLGAGRDIPAALYAAVSGQPIQPGAQLTEKDIITLFPQEWIRDPGSAFLRSGYHDVPWEEPELVRACLRKRRKQGAWLPAENWTQALTGVSAPAATRPSEIPGRVEWIAKQSKSSTE